MHSPAPRPNSLSSTGLAGALHRRMAELGGLALILAAAALSRQAPAAGAGGLPAGSSIPVATAALQSLVQDIATNAGASLASVESLPGETTAGYRRVGVKLSLSASWPVGSAGPHGLGQRRFELSDQSRPGAFIRDHAGCGTTVAVLRRRYGRIEVFFPRSN